MSDQQRPSGSIHRHAGWFLATVICVTQAPGQFGDPPIMSQEQCEQHIGALELDDVTADAVRTAFNAYAFERAGADRAWKVRQHWTSASPMSYYAWDKELNDDFNDQYDGFELRYRRAIREIEDQYFAEAAKIVPSKSDLVQAVCRERRRAWMLDPDVIQQPPAGALYDLVAAVERLGIPIQDGLEIATIVQEYEMEQDRLLRQWQDTMLLWRDELRAAHEGLERAAQERGEQGAAAEIRAYADVWTSRFEPCAAMRALTARTVDRLSEMLSSDAGAHPQDDAWAELFRFVYEHDQPMKVIQAAERLADLSHAQREALAALKVSFRADRKSACRAINPLYEATVDVEAIRHQFATQALMLVRKDYSLSVATDHHRKFDQATQEWKTRSEALAHQALDVLIPAQREAIQ